MPRPLKSVSPDTLGGKIRAARQALRLSLSEVAGEKYSTSLVSQIERNKIEPSEESLKYLADRLNLQLDELVVLAQLHRDSEAEALRYNHYEEIRAQASRLLESNRPRRALELLKDLLVTHVPSLLRWRMVALRGQCYFQIREFLRAQQDFLTAITILPDPFPNEYHMELVLLRLHLAAASRELGQYEEAYTRYQDALVMMNTVTPLRFIAETHWGISLVLYEQGLQLTQEPQFLGAGDLRAGAEQSEAFKPTMKRALRHAENARTLYNSIEETLRTALLSCQIALIEQSLGNLDGAREQLQLVLEEWEPAIEDAQGNRPLAVAEKIRRYNLKERTNVVSAAACYLASVEHEAKDCDKALMYIDKALAAAENSYILRRADAYMTKGQILAGHNDEQATEAFRSALQELEKTDRLGAKMRVHRMLGAHLIRIGQVKEGEKELDEVFRIARIPPRNKAMPDDTDKNEIFLN